MPDTPAFYVVLRLLARPKPRAHLGNIWLAVALGTVGWIIIGLLVWY